MKIQHLVLEDDVHKALKARKKTTGITVKEIGNSALRAALSLPTLEDLVIDKLVETKKISREDYERATAQADKDLRAAYKRAFEAAVPVAPQRWTIGSWELAELYRDPQGKCLVMDSRACDGSKTPTPVLVYDHSHAWGIVIEGRIRMAVAGEERSYGPGEVIHVPPGTPHTSAPLTRTTRALLVSSPAVSLQDFLGGKEKAGKPSARARPSGRSRRGRRSA